MCRFLLLEQNVNNYSQLKQKGKLSGNNTEISTKSNSCSIVSDLCYNICKHHTYVYSRMIFQNLKKLLKKQIPLYLTMDDKQTITANLG